MNNQNKSQRIPFILAVLESALFLALGGAALIHAVTAELSPVQLFVAGCCFAFGVQIFTQNLCYLIMNRDKFK